MKFIEIPANSIKRLEKQELCTICKEPAIWSIFGPRSIDFLIVRPNTPQHFCSICILYESKWGLKNSESLKEFLNLVSQNRQLNYLDEKLIASDADHILSSLVITNSLKSIAQFKK